MTDSLSISGENLDDLIRLFPYIQMARSRDGLVNITAEQVPNQVMVPFLRALMRTEARLLREDADQLTDDDSEPRTSDQRRADAFVELVVNVGNLTRYRDSRDDAAT